MCAGVEIVVMGNKSEENFGHKWTVGIRHTDMAGHNCCVVTGWFVNNNEAQAHVKLLRKALNYRDIVKEASK